MACRSVSWPPLHTLSEKRSNFAPLRLPHNKLSTLSPNCGRKLASNNESHHFAMNCLSNGKGDFSQQEPPQDALLKAISGMYFHVSLYSLKLEGLTVCAYATQLAGIIVAFDFPFF